MNLIQFLNQSPTAFHVCASAKELLKNNGFTELFEHEKWDIKNGGNFFVTRNSSSLIAFSIPSADYRGMLICASHTDSPALKLKASPELNETNGLVRLNVEAYGGMIKRTWFDRPLSVAGRVAVKNENTIEEKLVDISRPVAVIPSLAIHMDRNATDGNINIQKELLPVVYTTSSKLTLFDVIAQSLSVSPSNITGSDLFLYNTEKAEITGLDDEFISGGRIDNAENVYLSLSAFLKSENNDFMKVFAAFDNEETGSLTRQGADSTFLTDTLERIPDSLSLSKNDILSRYASSFVMSADNAHAAHPNYMEKADIVNRPKINGGIVLKYNASGKYTTDAISAAVVKELALRADIPVQEYHNRSDIPGGSTLGNILNCHISLHSADIGLAQLAMHSAYETAGLKDTVYMEKFLTEFYTSKITATDNGIIIS